MNIYTRLKFKKGVQKDLYQRLERISQDFQSSTTAPTVDVLLDS